jgi:excinuclease ABC subunit C
MKRCPGPCVFEVDRDGYLEQVAHASLFLAGRHEELNQQLRDKMATASAELAFERAALYRDQLRAIEDTLATQHVSHLDDLDEDLFGLAHDEVQVQVVVLQVRTGKIVGRHDFHRKGKHFHDSDASILSSVVSQYYEPEEVPLPQFVLTPSPLDDAEALAELLTERRGRKVQVLWPQRGRRLALIQLAQTNARRALDMRHRSLEDTEATLEAVARALGLSGPPRTIECIDLAHRGSGRAVAAIAQLRDGEPSKAGTRSFTVASARAGDDYGGMYEVLSRRFRRARDGDERWALPDLLVVDGGRGQLAVAQAALRDVGIPAEKLPLVGLAKERAAHHNPDEQVTKEATVERVYVPGRVNPIQIRGSSPLLLLCRARDEAHRLAGKLLARRDKAKALGSPLDDIPGVGPKLRKALLRQLGSLKAVQAASVEELQAVQGVGPGLARTIHEHFQRSPSSA